MDFGDILNDWEKSERQAKKQQGGKKKANAPQAVPSEQGKSFQKRVNPMDEWIRRYGIVDKDALAQKHSDTQSTTNRKSAKTLPIEACIDLHSFTQEEASIQLDNFITTCKRRGLKKVLIVHGKGNHSQDNPVLGDMVRNFIERDTRLGASGHPNAAGGGRGATWTIIKKI